MLFFESDYSLNSSFGALVFNPPLEYGVGGIGKYRARSCRGGWIDLVIARGGVWQDWRAVVMRSFYNFSTLTFFWHLHSLIF